MSLHNVRDQDAEIVFTALGGNNMDPQDASDLWNEIFAHSPTEITEMADQYMHGDPTESLSFPHIPEGSLCFEMPL